MSVAQSYARRNQSSRAEVDWSQLFGQGSFKNVWAGRYLGGPRNGQHCVVKSFKDGCVYEAHYFEEELNVVAHTQEIVNSFNRARIISRDVRVNAPEIWKVRSRTRSADLWLVEPMIENFHKYNTNSGHVSDPGSKSSDDMQALSHFSYHVTNGEYLLCDIQGGDSQSGFILTDPIIMSRSGTKGPGDLGRDGMKSFFKRHVCSRKCNSHWLKPDRVHRAVFPRAVGTTMAPVRGRRGHLSNVGGTEWAEEGTFLGAGGPGGARQFSSDMGLGGFGRVGGPLLPFGRY